MSEQMAEAEHVLVRTDPDGRRHFRVAVPASGRGKKKRTVTLCYSLAPLSLEKGSPWSNLIDLLVERLVEDLQKEQASLSSKGVGGGSP